MRTLFFTLLILTGVVFVSQTALAAGLVPCEGPECQTCSLIELANRIIAWLVGFLSAAGALIFAYGGFLMVTSAGDMGKVSHAKELMTNVVVGLVIFLSGYLVVDTVLKTLLNKSILGAETSTYGPWNKIQCVPRVTFSNTVTGTLIPVSGNVYSHTTAVGVLSNLGVEVVSSGNCTDRNNKNCTSLEGIQQTAFVEIVQTIEKCVGCNLQITAGTEVGHSSTCHVNGTCVDIRCEGGCSSEQVAKVNSSAIASGASVVYETISCSARDAAKAQGINAFCKSDSGYGHITGDHFSLYTEGGGKK
jgi:hypothetical protein